MTTVSAATAAIAVRPDDLRARARAALRAPAGRLVMVTAATALLAALKTPFWFQMGVILAATSLLPERRRMLLLVGTIGWAFLYPPVDELLLARVAAPLDAGEWVAWWPVSMAAVWLLAFAFLWTARQFPTSPIARRPVLWLVGIAIALFAAARAPVAGPVGGPARVMLAAAAMAYAQYLWFFAFWVTENLSREKGQPLLRTYAWRPFWGFTGVPIGKGSTYLDRTEAKDEEQLAKSQIAGLKLLLRAVFWTAVLIAVKRVVYGPTESLTKIPHVAPQALIPTYQMSLEALVHGHPYPLHLRWAALICYFALWVIYFTIFGHKVVAVARLAGFNIFRNTYRPFLATSIADFYNRIYYYFKELLVQFFFYPTYLRYFKKRPKVRLFAATLAAAGLGNFLFHFLRTEDRILTHGLLDTLWFYRSYAVYALVLGVAISLSQIRSLANKGKEPSGVRRWLATAWVMLFFCLMCIIEEPNERHTMSHYGAYFLSLFRP
ncbi:MAG TPA: hypothetical protein VER17_19320 [Tepidisphaeraceae bacterium]|nr:hypothetical protein [Tepidisphaeraceae bacterium]